MCRPKGDASVPLSDGSTKSHITQHPATRCVKIMDIKPQISLAHLGIVFL
jgi:hypothetical protein